jgi:hypothetical protein
MRGINGAISASSHTIKPSKLRAEIAAKLASSSCACADKRANVSPKLGALSSSVRNSSWAPGLSGIQRTATRPSLGTAAFMSWSHFPL